ncbi:MAG: 50S ribosomal protein L17, partial [bacterium]
SKLHNRREVMKTITNTMVVDKLFEDLAVRYQERKGGYTRILKLVNRPSDNSEMALLELVDKKEQVELKEAAIAKRNVGKTASKEGKAAKTPKAPKEPKVKAEKKTASKPKAKKATK